MQIIIELIIFFFVYSFFGWILEVFYVSIQERRLVNRGFLKGPLCPIYGFGAILIIMIMELDTQSTQSIFIKLLLSIFLISFLEYITGALLQKNFKRKWWDYSQFILNINGHVCLLFSSIWGALAFLLINFFHPRLMALIKMSSNNINMRFIYVGLIYFFIDTIYSYKSMSDSKIFSIKSYYNEEQFNEYLIDIVEHDSVMEMKCYCHHRGVSCYQHSWHVAHISYIICSLLGLDSRAAARGGFLHDFFLYDWRTTRPEEGLHAFVHPTIAYRNACKFFEINDIEKNCIIRHMWPLTFTLPKYPESFIVCLVDKYCASIEIIRKNKTKILGKD